MRNKNTDLLEQSKARKIRELEEILKDLSKGTPTCRAIARTSIDVLKQNKLLNIHSVLGREL